MNSRRSFCVNGSSSSEEVFNGTQLFCYFKKIYSTGALTVIFLIFLLVFLNRHYFTRRLLASSLTTTLQRYRKSGNIYSAAVATGIKAFPNLSKKTTKLWAKYGGFSRKWLRSNKVALREDSCRFSRSW